MPTSMPDAVDAPEIDGPPEWLHVHGSMRDLLEIEGRDRITKNWERIWIPTSSTKEAFIALTDCMNKSASTKPKGMILVGDADTGKSRTMAAFAKANAPADDGASEYREHPAIYLKAPDNPSPMVVYRSILTALGQPILYNPSEGAMRIHALRMMQGCKVGVVMIDEIADVKARIDAQTLQFLRFLKNLINETERPFALGGTSTLLDLLRQDKQIVSRFDNVVPLKPFKEEEFVKILRAYERLMPLRRPSTIARDPKAIHLLLDRSDGLIGRLSGFLESACKIAIESREERLTFDVLQKVPDRSIRAFIETPGR